MRLNKSLEFIPIGIGRLTNNPSVYVLIRPFAFFYGLPAYLTWPVGALLSTMPPHFSFNLPFPSHNLSLSFLCLPLLYRPMPHCSGALNLSLSNRGATQCSGTAMSRLQRQHMTSPSLSMSPLHCCACISFHIRITCSTNRWTPHTTNRNP